MYSFQIFFNIKFVSRYLNIILLHSPLKPLVKFFFHQYFVVLIRTAACPAVRWCHFIWAVSIVDIFYNFSFFQISCDRNVFRSFWICITLTIYEIRPVRIVTSWCKLLESSLVDLSALKQVISFLLLLHFLIFFW